MEVLSNLVFISYIFITDIEGTVRYPVSVMPCSLSKTRFDNTLAVPFCM